MCAETSKPPFDITFRRLHVAFSKKSISEGKNAENAYEPNTLFRGKRVQKCERVYRIST